MIRIHRGTSAHLEDIAKLFDAYRVFYKQGSNYQAARTFISQRIKNNDSIIFVAYTGDEALGFTQLYPVFSSVSMQGMCILNDLFVVKEHRNQGIAKKLLDHSKQYAVEAKLKGLSLETARDNPAQKLYEREGWVKDEDFLHYFWKNDE